jgi:AbiV family abortive infection protein
MEITEELWNDLKKNTLSGVLRLLESANILLSSGGDEAICAGLLSYAIEEYGKLILLTEYIPQNGRLAIKPEELFVGNKTHKSKFKTALDNLPDECKHIGKEVWTPGVWAKDAWLDASSVVADFESRKAIFYCGLDKSNKAIMLVPLVGKKNLEKAIEKFKTIAFSFSLT